MKLILLCSLVLNQVAGFSQSNRRWRAATYRGITIGKSHNSDMLRVFGQPKWAAGPERRGSEEEAEEIWNHYDGVGEFPGSLTVVLDKRRDLIVRIDFYPSRLSKAEAVAHFGPHYLVTRYDFDRCGADEESEPIYESRNGPLTYIEYRARGIAIFVSSNNMVTKISYVSGPVGSAKSKCR